MTHFILLFFFFFGKPEGNANDLSKTNLLRIQGKEHIKNKSLDSARLCFEELGKYPVYADATDHLILSSCLLQLQDTANFKKELTHSIEKGGADSNIVFAYFRQNTRENYSYFRQVLDSIFVPSRLAFSASIDTSIAQEMDEIHALDQLVRQSMPSKDNLPYIKDIGRYIDSINYARVVKLIEQNRFPGFHNFGIMASKYDVILMHITDHDDERWNYIFKFLKKEVLAGNITANQVVTIATRHFSYKDKCTYYGTQKMGATKLCNCKEVDKYRREIGLDNLKSEYGRLGLSLPECYGSEHMS